MSATLITGGARGIGRATALLAGDRGWSVAINYLVNRQAAEDTATAVRNRGGQAIIAQGDMACDIDVERVFDAAASAFGGLAGVVINAGIVAPIMQLADMGTERLRRMFEVNVLGAYFCARAAARRLPQDRGGEGGSIVLLSSAAARLGGPFEYVDYAGSKAALDALTIGLARELAGQGVRVNAIRPGLIDTEIHAGSGQADRAHRLGGLVPMGRPGRPEEVAEAIIWLLSESSSYTTGAILDVAGGR